LTKEALALYFRHLKPKGILALHVSNRYLNLVPVCARGAETFGKTALVVEDDGYEEPYLSSSTWVLVTAAPEWFRAPAFFGATTTTATAPRGFRTWTDAFSNVYQILKFK
jgi:hypothetical protein